MDEVIANSLSKLVTALENDERVLSLQEDELTMLKSKQVQSLIKNKDKAEENLNKNILAYGENGPKTVEVKKQLHQAKLELDTHPLVQTYNASYIKVRDLYAQLDKILFDTYRDKPRCRK